jgi:hypothetical protein
MMISPPCDSESWAWSLRGFAALVGIRPTTTLLFTMRKLAEKCGFDFEKCLQVVAASYSPIHQLSLSGMSRLSLREESVNLAGAKDGLCDLLQPLGHG